MDLLEEWQITTDTVIIDDRRQAAIEICVDDDRECDLILSNIRFSKGFSLRMNRHSMSLLMQTWFPEAMCQDVWTVVVMYLPDFMDHATDPVSRMLETERMRNQLDMLMDTVREQQQQIDMVSQRWKEVDDEHARIEARIFGDSLSTD